MILSDANKVKNVFWPSLKQRLFSFPILIEV